MSKRFRAPDTIEIINPFNATGRNLYIYVKTMISSDQCFGYKLK